jgi:diguanylate cyclase (GGDEF)-like protein
MANDPPPPHVLVVEGPSPSAPAVTALGGLGAATEVVGTIAAARDRLGECAFDFVVLAGDPAGAGLSFCAELRTQPATRTLPVLYVADDEATIGAAFAAGATDFACTSWSTAVLEQRLQYLWRSCRHLRHLETSNRSAHRDALTGLPTRAVFVDRLEQAVLQARRNERRVAVLHVDIDRFGAINESLGRDVGDRLLRQISDRIEGCLRAGDTLARGVDPADRALSRLGGDQFILVLAGLGSEFEPGTVAARIIEGVAQPFHVDDTEVFVSASVGIAVWPDDHAAPDDLIRCAQTALGHAKSRGGGTYMFYSARMNSDAAARLDLASRLHRGLALDQFELVYQPIFDHAGERIRSVEALLRWRHPENGLVLPGEFVPIAEETGLILPLGAWVLERACRQWRSWLDAGIGPVTISINIAARQFLDAGFIAHVDNTLAQYGVDPAFFQFELSEGVLMGRGESTQATSRALRNRGIRLSVDDFGTGFSSLNFLRGCPADVLKIDRSFVRGVPEDQENCSLVAAIVAMAHKLRLSVVAEGIETEGQLRFLRALDCEQLQGFLLGRPATPSDLETRLRRTLDGGGGPNVVAFPRRAVS